MNRTTERNRMVREQLQRRGISDPRVLEAFRSVPREAFVPVEMTPYAYADAPLPIGGGQTISQPYIVGLTVQALRLEGAERVLEVGTGSGYAAAILARLAHEVFTVERHSDLAEAADARLRRLGFTNVRVRCGDGTLGWPEVAPFDAIAVAAGGPEVPPALLEQLSHTGRLVIPVGAGRSSQMLLRIQREGDAVRQEVVAEVRFVPLIGAQGWTNGGEGRGAESEEAGPEPEG